MRMENPKLVQSVNSSLPVSAAPPLFNLNTKKDNPVPNKTEINMMVTRLLFDIVV